MALKFESSKQGTLTGGLNISQAVQIFQRLSEISVPGTKYFEIFVPGEPFQGV